MSRVLAVFDLDGTILDLNVSPSQLERVKRSINDYFKTYGLFDGLRPLLPKIRLLARRATRDPDLQRSIVGECYAMIDEAETAPAGGVKVDSDNIRLLQELMESGVDVGIVSNNGRSGVVHALSCAGLPLNDLAFVVTRDDVCDPKPFPESYEVLGSYIDTHVIYFFSDDVFDLLGLSYLETVRGWGTKKAIVFNTDLRHGSYDWVTLCPIEWKSIKER